MEIKIISAQSGWYLVETFLVAPYELCPFKWMPIVGWEMVSLGQHMMRPLLAGPNNEAARRYRDGRDGVAGYLIMIDPAGKAYYCGISYDDLDECIAELEKEMRERAEEASEEAVAK